MRKPKSLATVFFTMAVVACCVLVPGVKAGESFDRLVPDNVTKYMTIKSYDRMMTELSESPYSGLMEEPEVEKFIGQVRDKMSGDVSEFTQMTGMEPEAMDKFFHGQVALAMRQKTGDDEGNGSQQFSVLLLSELGSNASEAEELLEKMMAKTEDQSGVSVSEVKINEHPVHHFVFQPDDKKGNGNGDDVDPELKERMEDMTGDEPMHVFVSMNDGVLAVSSGENEQPGMMESHLRLREGEGDDEPLADLSLYKDLMEQVDADSLYFDFQNYTEMWEDVQNQEQNMPLPFKIGEVVDELGLTGVEGQISTARFADEGLACESFSSISQPRKGILKSVEPANDVDILPPPFVSADPAFYLGGYFSVGVLWEEVQRVVKEMFPDSYEQMRMQIDNPQMPIHLEKDFIDTLGDRWFVYVPQKAVKQGDSESVNALIAIDVDKPDVLGETIDTIISMPQMQNSIMTEDVGGTTMYKTPPSPFFPGLYGGADAAPPIHVCLAIVDNKLLVGMSPDITRKAISGDNEASLKDAQDYRKMRGRMQDNPNSMLYLDQRVVGRWLTGALKDALKEEGLDLPGYQTMEKYLDVSVSTSQWTEDGLMMKIWMEFPESE
ncbi:MAG: hypothetical protein ACOC0A_01335 [Planctomycetota bacterium]